MVQDDLRGVEEEKKKKEKLVFGVCFCQRKSRNPFFGAGWIVPKKKDNGRRESVICFCAIKFETL